jgi:hypothetical protein
MSIPTVGPAAAARAPPGGIPLLRRQLIDDLAVYRCGLEVDATSGDPGLFGPGSATASGFRGCGVAQAQHPDHGCGAMGSTDCRRVAQHHHFRRPERSDHGPVR